MAMNYLAHLYLSQSTVESRVGNLLGDFSKGVDSASLPANVRAGLQNHRLVDRFTDQHPQVRNLKKLMSPERRRFAGVILDLAFDHFLIKHWHRFHSSAFETVCHDYYESLRAGQYLMPRTMQQVTLRVANEHWFGSYQTLHGVGYALDRIAQRIRFANQFQGSIKDLNQHQDQIEAVFLVFFEELIAHVQHQALET
ncbi:ACP phosphodiesterase [Paraferrimonas haliotis]|uniref:ACP phosphodiesterase n=1 Tax=Paraferrimonas haliotis TaxID=2013866 RepID=A0AA37TW60_9GAMM|nr:ACP phosphodiesterase [Paraferrimonas haliotis]GLS83995.1 ACP phosphodiesterase [Paraferrimonas haliotis]